MNDIQQDLPDLEVLENYLVEHLDGYAGTMSVQKISGGHSNPTFFLGGSACEGQYVLRKKPNGKLLPSAHAIDREYRVMSALYETDVPVPRMFHYCSDASVIGTEFYLMERIEGRVFHDSRLPNLNPSERSAIFDHMNATLAALHKVDFKAVGLSDYGRVDGYYERQLKRWLKQHALSPSKDDAPEIDQLGAWLKAHKPNDGANTTIVHGDFRLGNLIIHPTEPRVVAVLDWELSTLGHPLSDIGYNQMAWLQHADEYNGLADEDLAELGIPQMAEYAETYLERVGKEGPLDSFHVAFAFFRLAVIFEGVVSRAQSGDEAGRAEAKKLSKLIKSFARHGLSLTGE